MACHSGVAPCSGFMASDMAQSLVAAFHGRLIPEACSEGRFGLCDHERAIWADVERCVVVVQVDAFGAT